MTNILGKIRWVPALLLLVSSGSFVFSQSSGNEVYDVIIKSGRIMDGSGNPWVSGDIGLRGDRIARIGNLASASAKRVIDAGGLVVSPGFIDTLGQSEIALLVDHRFPQQVIPGDYHRSYRRGRFGLRPKMRSPWQNSHPRWSIITLRWIGRLSTDTAVVSKRGALP